MLQACTGSGKTLAYLLPILAAVAPWEDALAGTGTRTSTGTGTGREVDGSTHTDRGSGSGSGRVRDSGSSRSGSGGGGSSGVQAVVVAPTRELAMQIVREAERMVGGTADRKVGGTAGREDAREWRGWDGRGFVAVFLQCTSSHLISSHIKLVWPPTAADLSPALLHCVPSLSVSTGACSLTCFPVSPSFSPPSLYLSSPIIPRSPLPLSPPPQRLVQQLIGGASLQRQEEALRRHRPALVVGTPGRIAELSRSGRLGTHRCRFLVLDEADELLAGNKWRADVLRLLTHVGRRKTRGADRWEGRRRGADRWEGRRWWLQADCYSAEVRAGPARETMPSLGFPLLHVAPHS